MGIKKDRVFLIGLGVMTGMGDDDWKPDLILKLFSLKISPNILAIFIT